MQNKKEKVAQLSIFSNLTLIIAKLIAGLLSGSVSIISEAIHSTMDLLASIIAYIAVKISDKPADKDHPFGHGKYENVSGVIEALLILVASIWIIYKAILKIQHNEPVENVSIGFFVMLGSATINYIVSRKLYKVAIATESVALEADALHLKTDVLTSLGVAFGLLLIYITKISILDPIVAILVALMILRESMVLLKKAFLPLLDVALSADEIKVIENIFESNNVDFHDLRTRKAGNYRFVEVHIELPGDMLLRDAHHKCDELEELIQKKIKYLHITIHAESKDSN